MNRETLEKIALETVSAELYYDLADTIDEASNEDLYKIISFKGNYKLEEAWQTEMENK